MNMAARMIKTHLCGIIDAVVSKLPNAGAESVDSRIRRIKYRACGFGSQLHLCPARASTA
jgi:transposase